MDERLKPPNRTYQEEALYKLALILDEILSTFYTLSTMSGITEFQEITPLLFVSDDIRNRILYYAQRAPLSANATRIAHDFDRNRTFRGASVVFESTMPNSSIWTLFDDTLSCFINAKSDNVPQSITGFATRSNDVIRIHFSASYSAFKKSYPVGYIHNCDSLLHSTCKDYQSIVSLDDIKRYSTTVNEPLITGRLYQCLRCGNLEIFEKMPLRRMLKHASGQPFSLT